jgi:single-strand DNA-binding protein
MNKVILKGRLTSKPELKTTSSDKTVCDFSIAVNRRFNREQTDFVNCQAWRGLAEFINKYFSKGQEILVIGELHIDKWEKDGETRYTTRVVLDEAYFCGSKADNKPVEDITCPEGFTDVSEETDGLPF